MFGRALQPPPEPREPEREPVVPPAASDPIAELEAAAIAACLHPRQEGALLVGRCGDFCAPCRSHNRMIGHLRFERWLVEHGRQELDLPDDYGPPRVTVGQALEVYS